RPGKKGQRRGAAGEREASVAPERHPASASGGAQAGPDSQGARRRVHRPEQQGGLQSGKDRDRRREIFRGLVGAEGRGLGDYRAVRLGAIDRGRRGGQAQYGAGTVGIEANEMNQFYEAAVIALGAIWANKLRSFLTVLGNIVAVTSIIAVVSLVQGMNGYVTNAILSGVGADNFTIQRMPVVRTEADEERVRNNPRITLDEAVAVRKYSENVGAVAAQTQSRSMATFGSETVDGVQVQGVSREYIYFGTFNAEQ